MTGLPASPTPELRERRERLHLTQADVARMAKVSQPYIGLAERGRCAPAALVRIEAALAEHEKIARVEQERAKLAARVDAAWENAPDSEFKRLMFEQLSERAVSLLEVGECDAADHLFELLPTREARRLLDEFFGED